VTLTLAYSMKKMMADQAMVRKLSACETMGVFGSPKKVRGKIVRGKIVKGKKV
jgi:hypothetical protein